MLLTTFYAEDWKFDLLIPLNLPCFCSGSNMSHFVFSNFFYLSSSVFSHSAFYADDLKLLRVAMSSFFDMLLVCSKTLMEFDTVDSK